MMGAVDFSLYHPNSQPRSQSVSIFHNSQERREMKFHCMKRTFLVVYRRRHYPQSVGMDLSGSAKRL